jgi:hypothetical protein
MRTHLLRTIYPPAAVADVEPDTGCACNDACFDPDTPPPVAKLHLDTAGTPANDDADHDDYYLGGYAGI